MIATVKYQIAIYSGEVTVNCDENDEDDYIITRAKSILKNKSGEFPFGYQSWTVISRC